MRQVGAVGCIAQISPGRIRFGDACAPKDAEKLEVGQQCVSGRFQQNSSNGVRLPGLQSQASAWTVLERPRPCARPQFLCPLPEIRKVENRKLRDANSETRVAELLSRGRFGRKCRELVLKPAIAISKSRVAVGCVRSGPLHNPDFPWANQVW